MNASQPAFKTATAPLLQREQPSLSAVLTPRSIAMFGACDKSGSIGATVLANVLASKFEGVVYPISSEYQCLLGVPTYPRLSVAPRPIDLAVITSPPATIPGIVAECVDAGVKGVVILSPGFIQMGSPGIVLARHVLENAKRGNMRVIGPNSFGIMNPATGLNATLAPAMALPGSIAFMSQSGAMCSAIIDWSRGEGLGFSGMVSLGSMIDTDWGDLIDHFGNDAQTRALLISLEDVGNARSFLSAAREVTRSKPIIVLKSRRPATTFINAADQGAPFDSEAVFDALLARAGVVRVESIASLFGVADLLGNQPRPKGRRLAIVTNAGVPSLLAADVATLGGSSLAELSPPTIAALDEALPGSHSHDNPIDVHADAPAEAFATAARLAIGDANCDGVLVVFSPQGMTDPTRTAELVVEQARCSNKPIFASWMGGNSVEGGRQVFSHAGIPSFEFPDTAACAWNTLSSYGHLQRLLYETPRLEYDASYLAPNRIAADAIIHKALSVGDIILPEPDAMELLKAYHVASRSAVVAQNDFEAIQHADSMGYPVVIKAHDQATHIKPHAQTEALSFGVNSERSLRTAFHAIRNFKQSIGHNQFHGVSIEPIMLHRGYELSFLMQIDAQLGPVIAIRLSGQLPGSYRKSAYGLPPLTSVLAQSMIDQIHLDHDFSKTKDEHAIDVVALGHVLMRFSQMVVDQPRLKSVTIDPVLAIGDSFTALKARIELHDSALPDLELPHPAVRPYPVEYCFPITLNDGTAILLRPVRPEDEPAFVMMHQQLSEQTVHLRYFVDLPLKHRVEHMRLARICHRDYDREIALVAERAIPGSSGELIGVGRLSQTPSGDDAEVALLVTDCWQNHGLGAQLLAAVIEVAKRERIRRLTASFLPENHILRKMLTECGFVVSDQADQLMHAHLVLR